MSITILEALQNADYNLRNNGAIGVMIAKEQLHNAVTLLDKGYDLNVTIDPIITKYENIEDAPDIR